MMKNKFENGVSKMWQVKIHKKVKIKNPILIEGLPGIANVGKVVADYLIEQFKAEKIMTLFSYSLPNSVFVNDLNLVELPKIEIYYKKIAGRDYLFLAGDVQPANEQGSYTFSEKVLDIAQGYGCEEIITLGGIGLPEIPAQPKVYCTGNHKEMISKFTHKGANKNVYGVVGPIIGVSGLLVGLSTQRKIRAAALLAETYGHPMYLGLKGAKESLRILSKVYGIKVDYKDINKEIRMIEEDDIGDSKNESPSLKRLKKLKETNYIG
jgi:uncharacterized protein (TIGR00162 family)